MYIRVRIKQLMYAVVFIEDRNLQQITMDDRRFWLRFGEAGFDAI